MTPVLDSIQAQQRDTTGRKKTDISPKGVSPQERTPFGQNTSLNIVLSTQANQQQFARIVDSVLRINPILRAPLLKELLIPSGPLANYPPASGLDAFNQQLLRDSKFSSFERMGLIAKRYAITNPNPNAFSTHQIDIIGTILWLYEVLK
jgi:hypothetical protein